MTTAVRALGALVVAMADGAQLALVATAPAPATLLGTGGAPPPAPVATQTAAIGIITPPPDIRSIVVRPQAAHSPTCVRALRGC